jgi:histidinol-phosphate aminotransferase
LVVDEAYAEYCSQPSAIGLIGDNEHLVVLRTLSKAWAGAGLRCGTVLAQPTVISLLRRIIAPYPLASPVTSLASLMLGDETMQRQKDMLQAVKANKRRLLGMIRKRPFILDLWPGEANFILFRTPKADELLMFCARRGVILRGYPNDPSLSDCIRISVGSDEDLTALEAALNAWEAQS